MAGDDVRRQCVRVDKVRGERAWVTELVAAGLHRQRHRQVVALCKAEEQVLHGGAGCFVGLEEGHIGVLGLQARSRVRTENGAAKMEGLEGPGEKRIKCQNLFVAPLAPEKLQHLQTLTENKRGWSVDWDRGSITTTESANQYYHLFTFCMMIYCVIIHIVLMFKIILSSLLNTTKIMFVLNVNMSFV